MFCKVCAFLEFVHAGIDWIMGIKEPESGFIEYRLFCTSCHANDWPKKTLYRKSLCSINSEDGSLKLGVRELPTNLQTDMVYASKSTKICKSAAIIPHRLHLEFWRVALSGSLWWKCHEGDIPVLPQNLMPIIMDIPRLGRRGGCVHIQGVANV